MILIEIPQKTLVDELLQLSKHIDKASPTKQVYIRGMVYALQWVVDGGSAPSQTLFPDLP